MRRPSMSRREWREPSHMPCLTNHRVRPVSYARTDTARTSAMICGRQSVVARPPHTSICYVMTL